MPLYAPIATDEGPDAVLSAPLAIDGDEISLVDTALMPDAGDVSFMRFGVGEVVKVTGAANNPYTIERAIDGTIAAAQLSGAELRHVGTPSAVAMHTHPKADVGLSNVDNTSDANKPVSNAQATADDLRVLKAGDIMGGSLAFVDAGLRLRRGGSQILLIEANSVETARADVNRFRVAPTRRFESAQIQGTGSIRLSETSAYQGSAEEYLYEAIDATQTTIRVYGGSGDLSGIIYPHSFWIERGEVDEEVFIALAAPTLIDEDSIIYEFTGVLRGRPLHGAVGKAHAEFAAVRPTNSYDMVDGYVLPHENVFNTVFGFSSLADPADPIRIYQPPRGSVGGWTAPAAGQVLAVSMRETSGADVQVKEFTEQLVLATVNGADKSALMQYSATNLRYTVLGVNP